MGHLRMHGPTLAPIGMLRHVEDVISHKWFTSYGAKLHFYHIPRGVAVLSPREMGRWRGSSEIGKPRRLEKGCGERSATNVSIGQPQTGTSNRKGCILRSVPV